MSPCTTVEKVPRALQLLNTYRPKPFGGLDKRVTVSMVAMTDPKPSLAKDEAAKFLPELVALAGYAGELAGPAGDAPAEGGATAAGIPAYVIKAYTRGKLTALEAKCRDLISDQVNQLAAGKRRRRFARVVESIAHCELWNQAGSVPATPYCVDIALAL